MADDTQHDADYAAVGDCSCNKCNPETPAMADDTLREMARTIAVAHYMDEMTTAEVHALADAVADALIAAVRAENNDREFAAEERITELLDEIDRLKNSLTS